MKRAWLACLLVTALQTAAAADDPLPAGALRRGTLANAQLINDSKLGVAQHVGALGCTALGNVDTYVTQMPVGEPGKRQWKELWIVSGCNKRFPVHLTFTEDATGASWSIQ